MVDDAGLLKRSREGQTEAFAELVSRYQNLVCAVTFGGTGDRDRAVDLAQETFVTAWSSLASLREDSKFRPWVCGIARNLVRKAQRRAEQRQQDVDALPEEVEDPTAGASQELEARETQAMLRDILAKMDGSLREPLVLFYWEGCSAKQVAARLDLSVAAVEQRISRGRRAIKAEFEARLERALKSAKPGPQFGGLVMAAIGQTDVGAATAVGSARFGLGDRGWGIPVAGAMVAALLAGGALIVSGHSGREETTPTVEPQRRVAALVTPRGSADVSSLKHAPRSGPGRSAEGMDGVPPPERTELGAALVLESFPNRVIVNLRGGTAELTEEQRSKLAGGSAMPYNKEGPVTDLPTRRVEGLVVDHFGKPVEGATVVMGQHLLRGSIRHQHHQLSGQAGDTTDRDGTFSFEATTRISTIVAVAGGHGFSRPRELARGEQKVELRLMLEGTATLEGDLSVDGEPAPGTVLLRMSPKSEPRAGLVSRHKTDPSGHYRATLLPPGAYDVFASVDLASDSRGGKGPVGSKTGLVVAPHETTIHDFELSNGATIEFRASRPGRLTYYAFPGAQVHTWKEASALLSGGGQNSSVGSTPDDAEAFAVIHVPQKPLTVCAVRPFKLFEGPSYAECRTLPAPDPAEPAVEVVFDPPMP